MAGINHYFFFLFLVHINFTDSHHIRAIVIVIFVVIVIVIIIIIIVIIIIIIVWSSLTSLYLLAPSVDASAAPRGITLTQASISVSLAPKVVQPFRSK